MTPANPHAIRAKHQGEALAHCVVRAAFLRHVAADARTMKLFAMWGDETGVDAVVADMVVLLDAAARRAGLAHRSELRRPASAIHLAPILGFLQRHEAEYERRLEQTMPARAKQAIGFVVFELFGTVDDDQVPIRAWLATDLMRIFQWSVAAHVYGERVPLIVGVAPTVTAVPKGLRRKGGGAHLEQYATWFYRAAIADPKVTHAQLAGEWARRMGSDGKPVFRAPKDRKDIHERDDTKLVRAGILEAKRLLELTVPPEQWNQYVRNQA